MPLNQLETFEKKIAQLKTSFHECSDRESIYQHMMQLGHNLPKLSSEDKNEDNRVMGCQSMMYLKTIMVEDRFFFEAESDALISAGLAALLLQAYNGEKLETILKKDPDYLKELGIIESITLNRANGIYSILLKMRQSALAATIKAKIK